MGVFDQLRAYLADFNNAKTPEAEALARFGIQNILSNNAASPNQNMASILPPPAGYVDPLTEMAREEARRAAANNSVKGVVLVDNKTGKPLVVNNPVNNGTASKTVQKSRMDDFSAAFNDALNPSMANVVPTRWDNHDVLHGVVPQTETNKNPAADMYGTGAVTTPKLTKTVNMHGLFVGPEAPQVAELTRLRDQRNKGADAYASGDPALAQAQWERQQAIDARIAELEKELTAAGLDVRTDFQRTLGIGQPKQTTPVDAQRKITDQAFRKANAFMPLDHGEGEADPARGAAARRPGEDPRCGGPLC